MRIALLPILLTTMLAAPFGSAAGPATRPSAGAPGASDGAPSQRVGPVSGAWSVDAPADWTIEMLGPDRSTVRLTPPDRAFSARFLAWQSVFGGPTADPRTLDSAFAGAEPVGEARAIAGAEWNGLLRLYTRDGSAPSHLVGVVAIRGESAVLLAVESPQPLTSEQNASVAGLLSRLQIRDTARPASPGAGE